MNFKTFNTVVDRNTVVQLFDFETCKRFNYIHQILSSFGINLFWFIKYVYIFSHGLVRNGFIYFRDLIIPFFFFVVAMCKIHIDDITTFIRRLFLDKPLNAAICLQGKAWSSGIWIIRKIPLKDLRTLQKHSSEQYLAYVSTYNKNNQELFTIMINFKTIIK